MSTRSARQSTDTAPGMWPARWTSTPVPSGRQRASRIRTPGRPRCSASHSVVARISGRARPDIVGMIRAVVAPQPPDDDRLTAVRAALPALDAGIYLNTGSVGPVPAESAAAMDELLAYELHTGRAHTDYWHETLQRMAEARAAVAAVLTVDAADIALNHSSTDGMSTAAWSIDWHAGERAVTTSLEHPGGIGALYNLRDRLGVELVFVDVGP